MSKPKLVEQTDPKMQRLAERLIEHLVRVLGLEWAPIWGWCEPNAKYLGCTDSCGTQIMIGRTPEETRHTIRHELWHVKDLRIGGPYADFNFKPGPVEDILQARAEAFASQEPDAAEREILAEYYGEQRRAAPPVNNFNSCRAPFMSAPAIAGGQL